ncbi:MAG: trigger factor [Pedosphaera sp.]|nr:trigger factor [Pedosphaera sp.]
MNVSVDHLGPCKKLLRVEVPLEAVSTAFSDISNQFRKEAQFPGFRPGRAPQHLVVKAYEPRIVEETRKKLFGDSYRAAAQREKLDVLVTLNVEEQQFGRGIPYIYNVTCEVVPVFTVPEYKGLTARREIAVPSDADVDRAMNILREQQVKYNDVAREVLKGDVVVVNYVATIDGKPLTEIDPTARGLAEKQNFWIAVAEGSFLPGFTEQLQGAKIGDRREVKVEFPAEFVSAELSKRQAVYAVEIVGLKEKVLPEVNEEFARSLGAASVWELTDGIRRDLQNELSFRQKRDVRDQLLKELLSRVDLELPESVVASETRDLIYSIVNENQKRGVPKDAIEQKKDEIYAGASQNARERVKATFVLKGIARAESIKADQKDIINRVSALAQQNEVSVEKMVKQIQERKGFPEIEQGIVTDKVMDLIELNAKIDDVPSTRP